MLRECEVWARPKGRLLRLIHRLTYGHDRHVCQELRQFAAEHEGNHQCGSCAFFWPHQSTDND